MPSLTIGLLIMGLASRPVRFSFSDGRPHASVVVVGGFNAWDRAKDPLKPSPDGRTWTGEVAIPVGVYPYLFCLDGREWVPDPAAPRIPDGNGNTNSKLVVAPEDYGAPARRGDGRVTASALRAGDAFRMDADHVALRARTRAGDVRRVEARVGTKSYPMTPIAEDELYETWQGEVPSSARAYRIVAADGEASVEIGTGTLDAAKMPLPSPPAWTEDAVFYQIFPDRYANGDPANDPKDVQPWDAPPTPTGWKGGDLKGIASGLDRIAALGVTGLYLNPVFAALSNHGYDTVDYTRVDPRFGTNADLKALVSEGHARGLRTILDGVFNHTSPEFFAFADLRAKGAESRYRDWYAPLAFPIVVGEGQRTYRTFAGVFTMPKLNLDDPEARAYFAGIGARWIREAGVDGWRLDVADEIAPGFWPAFRAAVRAAKPDAYTVAETWHDPHELVAGDGLDAAMNYPWRAAVLDLVNRRITPAEFVTRMRAVEAGVPRPARRAMFDVLGSHDTERLRTVVGGSEARHRLAAAVQFFSPGVPVVYYGDEYGLEGGKEPASRNPMPVSPTSAQLAFADFYRSLAAMRKGVDRSRAFTVASSPSGAILTYRAGRVGTRMRMNVSPRPVACRTRGEVLLSSGLAGGRLAPDGFVIERGAPL